jgi:hypothetical protein
MEDARTLVRNQFALAHRVLGMIMEDVPDAVAHSVPAGTIRTIATIYAHLVTSEDFMVNAMAQGKPTLLESGGWSAPTGVPVPTGPFMTEEWLAGIEVKLGEFREYAKAVFAQTDDFLANATEDVLAKEMAGPMGPTTPWGMLSTIGLYHSSEHAGEIAALKGVQDLK